MLRPALLFLAFTLSIPAYAQCDTAEMRAWLRNLDYDTVCKEPYYRKTSKQSFIRFTNDSTFSYNYHDSVTHNYSRRYYEDYYLHNWSYNRSDTHISISYYRESCQPMYHITKVYNDSLSTSDEGGTVYDYYHEIVYKEDGSKSREYWDTIVFRKGKRLCKCVYVDYEGIIDRRKVHYHEQTKGNN